MGMPGQEQSIDEDEEDPNASVTDPALASLEPNGDDVEEPTSKRLKLDEQAPDGLDEEAVLALAAHGNHPSSVDHYPTEFVFSHLVCFCSGPNLADRFNYGEA
jgi:hypothetical protein